MKVRSYIIAIIFNLLILAHLFAEEKYKVTLSLNLAEIDKKYYFYRLLRYIIKSIELKNTRTIISEIKIVLSMLPAGDANSG